MDTREQLLAQSTERHCVVTANAGSGKTRVLVSRYLNLLLDGVDPEEIIAITFTRKAASEMLERVAKEIDELNQKAVTSVELSKLKKIRERLTGARISTIHSFCSSVLRNFPIEAGINPNFVELNAAERLRIQNNAIKSALEARLLDSDGDTKQAAMNLIQSLGLKNLEEYLQGIISNYEQFESIKKLYSGDSLLLTDESRLTLLGQLILPMIADGLKELIYSFSLIELSNKKKAKAEKIISIKEQTEALLKVVRATLANADNNCLKEIIAQFRQIKEQVFTQKNELKVDFSELEFRATMNPIWEHVIELSEAFEYLAEDSNLVKQALQLIDLADDIFDNIEIEKEEAGGLDFDDLIVKTLKLLRNDEVAIKILRKVRFVLVDEFQDTNKVQYEIVKRLIPALSGLITEKNINLFIVGDAKQSIYGFRNADVRVFKQADDEIRRINERLLNTQNEFVNTPGGKIKVESDDEKYGIIKLSLTFRMLPYLAAFVNRVSGNVMSESRSEFDVAYEPLICGRNLETVAEKNGKIAFLLSRIYSQDLVETESENNTEDEEVPNEAEMVALDIKKIINGNTKTVVRNKKDEFILPEYKDIAILARKKSSLEKLSQTLNKHDIPYILHSGTSFFESVEIMDFMSVLKFLNNENDDIAFASTLRAPFFDISDNLIFEIYCEPEGNNLWEKYLSICRKYHSDDNRNVLTISQSFLIELKERALKMPVAQLIRKIVNETTYSAFIATEPSKKRMEANIERLITMARNFESRGFRNLNDFVRELELQAEAGSVDSESVSIGNENAVNLLTVHTSKGLEFPVVILYATNYRNKNPDRMQIDENFGITFPVSVFSDDENNFSYRVYTPLHRMTLLRRHLAELAEEKRLLYVAMTRAKDCLIVTGCLKISKEGKVRRPTGFLEMLLAGTGLKYSDLALMEQQDVHFTDRLEFNKNGTNVGETIDYKVEFIFNVEYDETGKAGESPERKLLIDYTQPVFGDVSSEVLSASKLMAYSNNTMEYYKKYIYGAVPAQAIETTSIPINTEIEEDEIIGSLVGTLLHSVMEHIPDWLEYNGNINEKDLKTIIDSVSDNSNRHISALVRDRIFIECKNIAETQLIKNYYQLFKLAKTEYSLYLPIKDDFLMGSIDMLIPDIDGNLEIWDWKSNRVSSKQDMIRLGEYYKMQMNVYAFLIMKLAPEQTSVTARLLFTRLAAKGLTNEDWSYSFTWSKEELIAFEEYLIENFEKIKNLYFETP
ncbi:MAG: Exonuclease subunit beta [Ignavibacteria bacterium]|nr:Exonuclease subunit beta [Ignavibacteria bacterium]